MSMQSSFGVVRKTLAEMEFENWVPQTPSKSTPASFKSEDILSTQLRSCIKKINPEITTFNPSTPKPLTPLTTSRKRKRSNLVLKKDKDRNLRLPIDVMCNMSQLDPIFLNPNILKKARSRRTRRIFGENLESAKTSMDLMGKLGPYFPNIVKKPRSERTNTFLLTSRSLPPNPMLMFKLGPFFPNLIKKRRSKRTTRKAWMNTGKLDPFFPNIQTKKRGERTKRNSIPTYFFIPRTDVKKLIPKVIKEKGGDKEERGKNREKFVDQTTKFVKIMHQIQGDRSFSEWKGSVVDSVVGVFLTQNVTDHVSSSAYMTLVSRFPRIETTGPAVKSILATASTSTSNSDWDKLRITYVGGERDTSGRYSDSANWEEVKQASPEQVVDAIKERGQQNNIASRIQGFFNRMVEDHNSIDLEWLRSVPPDKAKEYLQSFGGGQGLGPKSVACICLLSLHHPAFPADVNVARVAVRLGWVPLQPLPNGVEFHHLRKYPLPKTVQDFLWPLLCKLDHKTLYELHCHMITFGKLFCRSTKPSCKTCPMRGDCKHYKSQVASSRQCLPGTEKKGTITTDSFPQLSYQLEPAVKFSPSPVHVSYENLVEDIEDLCVAKKDENVSEDLESIIKLGSEKKVMKKRSGKDPEENDVSKALIALNSPASSIRGPELSETVHHVYELPDSHAILANAQVHKREPGDPFPYLLILWAPDADVGQSRKFRSTKVSIGSKSSKPDQDSETFPGTLMIPCRTAMKGRFPLNGTFYQNNEVFADYESAMNPIKVPEKLIKHLEKRLMYCGTSVTNMFTDDVSLEKIENCFRKGYLCVKAFDRSTSAPVKLPAKFHRTINS